MEGEGAERERERGSEREREGEGEGEGKREGDGEREMGREREGEKEEGRGRGRGRGEGEERRQENRSTVAPTQVTAYHNAANSQVNLNDLSEWRDSSCVKGISIQRAALDGRVTCAGHDNTH